ILLDNVSKIRSLFPTDQAAEMSETEIDTIASISKHCKVIKQEVDAMVEARRQANRIENERDKAIAYHDTVVPSMDVIRYHIDKLELMVDNEMWPLPKYRELLFIR
ncbi:MAG: glutamine synthetase type III, partial [Paramuribaculum sp.]|nr:glutamine synthetase type III [Paramuribaculum sp.]